MPNRKPLTALIGGLFLAASAAWLAAQQKTEPAAGGLDDTAAVLTKMHEINQLEITIGHLAEERGESAQIREFGDRLARDHAMADRMVLRFASELRVAIGPSQPGGESPAQQLAALQGPAFDRQFASDMTQGHMQAITVLESERDHAPSNSPMRPFLAKVIPILTQHYVIASRLDLRTTAGIIK